MSDFKNECYELASKHVLCIEFVLSDTERQGFHTGQLLHYRLEPNSDETDAPPEKLTLAFATADVVILGWKLSTLTNHLRDGDLLWVRSLPARYAGLHRKLVVNWGRFYSLFNPKRPAPSPYSHTTILDTAKCIMNTGDPNLHPQSPSPSQWSGHGAVVHHHAASAKSIRIVEC